MIVKKKNSFNKPSNYYAVKIDNSNLSILAQGLGKEQFYNNLDNLRKNRNNNSVLEDNLKKSNNKNSVLENKMLATKILIFFKLTWSHPPLFSEEFYDLNNYFISKTS